jgi:hypothetical protein
VTRRPKSRRPPKLPDPARERPPRAEREDAGPSLREQLKRKHVAGRSARFGREEIVGLMRRLVHGAPSTRLGLPRFEGLELTHVEAAVAAVFGWEGDGPRAKIAPDRTIEGFMSACERILEVAGEGGSLAFATARPASLHSLHRALAAAAAAAGGTVLSATESGLIGPHGRRVWWIDDVAVLTDHESLLAHDSVEAAEEVLFTLPRPDLMVADRTFAGAAVSSGLETVAFADLDALALAVAAWQGRALRVVPLDDRRPPAAYAPLLELLGDITVPVAAESGRASTPTGSAGCADSEEAVADRWPRTGS